VQGYSAGSRRDWELVLEREKTTEETLLPSFAKRKPHRVWHAKRLPYKFNGSMRKTPKTSSKGRRWSAEVTKRSDALDLETDVFKGKNPHRIAQSLKRSAERSKRRKGTPYQSAMSMLNFYINRAGKNLPKKQKQILERAKHELREVFGRQ
jgi:Protein of unknown function (DUF3175)